MVGGKGDSYSDGCRKARPTSLPPRSSGPEGGCCPAGVPCSPPPSPRPYLERTAEGTGAGGPSSQTLSCRPFAGPPGGAGSSLLTHPRAGDATGSQCEAEPRARPSRTGTLRGASSRAPPHPRREKLRSPAPGAQPALSSPVPPLKFILLNFWG